MKEETQSDLVKAILCDGERILGEVDEVVGDEEGSLQVEGMQIATAVSVNKLFITLSEVIDSLAGLEIQNTASEGFPHVEGLYLQCLLTINLLYYQKLPKQATIF